MTTETRKRRNHTKDFNRDVVALVAEQGYKVSEAARSLGFRDNPLSYSGQWSVAAIAGRTGAMAAVLATWLFQNLS
jgi:transposase-like protein